jgi:hypothetical protein
MKGRKWWFAVSGVLLTAVLVVPGTVSCAGGPETAEEQPAEEPDWVKKYPVDPAYFIGVGSSNTGDRGEDMDKARLDALAALAASIVTKIEAEIVVESTDDTEGNTYEKITSRIRENVNQNLQGVEPVDSYYSKEDGYWFYFRYPKEKLTEMKRDLTRRVLDMVGPGIEGRYPSIAEGLAQLWDGYSLIHDSPFVGTIDVEIGPYSGAFIDILQKEISRLSASLDIRVQPEELRIEQGETPEIQVFLDNSLGIPTGQLSAVFQADGKVIAKVITNRDGGFAGKIEPAGLDPGRGVGSWKADFGALGINLETVRLFAPEVSVFIEVEKRSVGLRAGTGDGVPFSGLGQSVSSLFSNFLPFEITDEYASDTTNILFTLHFRDLPENDFGLFFTFARAVISVEKSRKTLYSYESTEYKEGGITAEQARERAKAKLFEALAVEKRMFEEITAAAALK